MLSTQDVEMAYRLILGREPESTAVVEEHRLRFGNLRDLRTSFMGSAEFRLRNSRPVVPEVDRGPALAVETDPDPSLLPKILERVELCWQALG